MSESPGDAESVASRSTPDDPQLTIRIPNPRVYMERQSQWKGQRGKPRCDACREHNLKCDRVLPCNQCSFASGKECKYTPLPTPAHRGIPRCDRCRVKNLKCDRSLPVCTSCTQEPGAKCNYTPKKRRKPPAPPIPGPYSIERAVMPYGTRPASFTAAEMGQYPNDSAMASGDEYVSDGGIYTSDGEDAVPSRPPSAERSSRPPWSSAPRAAAPAAQRGPPPPPPPIPASGRNYVLDTGIVLRPPQIEPWTHSSFAPLPVYVLQRIGDLNALEMPPRLAFDEALTRFVGDLAPELQLTAAFPPKEYANLTQALNEGNTKSLSPRLYMWTTVHHVQLGSQKVNRLVLLKETFFHLSAVDQARLRQSYVMHADQDDLGAPGRSRGRDYEELNGEWARPFERLPVQPQIFDVLSYSHRAHNSSSSMLKECRRIGIANITWPIAEIYVRLCPVCNLRSRGQPFHQQMPPLSHAR